MRLKALSILMLFIAIFPFDLRAQYSYELSSMSGMMLSHTPFTHNLNHRKSLGLQSTVIWKLPPNNSVIPAHPPLNYRYLGFSIYGMDMGDGFLNGNKLLRNKMTPMGFGAGAIMIAGTNMHLRAGADKNDFRIQSGFGPMIVTKYYNPLRNPGNLAISSVLNFGSNLKAQFIHQIKPSSTVTIGFELLHASNSNFQKPNYGLNYVQGSIGWMYKFHTSSTPTHQDSSKTVKDRSYYVGKSSAQYASKFQISYRMAYRKYRLDYPVYYPVWILEGDYGISNKSIHVGSEFTDQKPLPKGEWRIGVNLFHESAATVKTVSGEILRIDSRWELGLYGRRVFRVGFMDVFIDLGTYLVPPQADRIKLLQKNKFIYNAFGTQYRVSKNIFIINRMKAHAHIADYLEIGLVSRL